MKKKKLFFTIDIGKMLSEAGYHGYEGRKIEFWDATHEGPSQRPRAETKPPNSSVDESGRITLN